MPSQPVSQDDGHTLDTPNWIAGIFRSLDIEECSAAITNETRLWSGWDRVSLLLRTGDKLRLKSVSGVQSIDPRSSTTQMLEEIAKSCWNSGEVLDSNADDPSNDCRSYHERCRTQRVVVLPIRSHAQDHSSEMIGVLVFDQFEKNAPLARSVSDLKEGTPLIRTALTHALNHSRLQQGFVARLRSSWTRGRLTRSLLVLGTIAFALLLLTTVPTELVIYGNGVLRPDRQRDVFAGANGYIDNVLVTTGVDVDVDTKLIELKSPELQMSLSELRGELATTSQQIDDLETLRTDPQSSSRERNRMHDLAARREELKALEQNIRTQIKSLEEQQFALTLRSPIRGTVLTPDLNSKLPVGRPVQRTDRLLRVADLKGPWIVELYVDQRDSGPVIEAVNSDQISIAIVTADAPNESFTATLQSIAPAMTVRTGRGVSLEMQATIDEDLDPGIRPGSSVQCRIFCGHRSIGRVWFRRMIDKLSAWWNLRKS
ncbi:HlyD family secretion protein [Thalassoglobus neptunius]|uniref:HlyD family secretion protein n=1 Tax=Thalassoglobus neptunius TaxID=1938619 RepID=A0A5C5XB51_9PLAN|nr:efflux RND transporter periplasmic adaptor subunit [Thalassoglobus neptunius]TWT59122.1 HlyD family secretion protein [Thalassoglobus neptunius]